MKFLVQNWSTDDDGILYFFQRLYEMLYSYSQDIVRTPVHNTKTLIYEFIQTEKEVNNNRVKSYQLEQILNELRDSLQSDKILREVLGTSFVESVASNLKKEKGTIVRYLNHKIPKDQYYSWCIDYIKKHAVIYSHKDEIEFGLRSWISMTIWYGYSSEYIFYYLQKSFSENILDAKQALTDFLEHFSCEEKTFKVYFSFNPCLSEYKEQLDEKLKVSFDDDGFFSRAKRNKHDFVGYIEVKSLDCYTAMNRAYRKINLFLKFYKVFSNQRKKLVRDFGIVIDQENQSIFKIPTRTRGYRPIDAESNENLMDIIDQVILACQNKEQGTYEKINRIIDLHNQAIRQHDLNDGFLNLWSILEIISVESSDESKIESVIRTIAPILQKDYFDCIFENILHDLQDNLSTEDYVALLDSIGSPENDAERIGRFIFLPEFETLREEYFKKLKNYPVIRTKIYHLWNLRNKKSRVMNLSERYIQRVKWHIYRLYRTRNAIVHSGEGHRKIHMLGEHLHIYVDRVLYELLIKLTVEKTLFTIKDVLIDTTLLLEKQISLFSVDSPVEAEDIEQLCQSYFYTSASES